MTLPMPTKYPQFAQNDNGTSHDVNYSNGQLNVVEPLEAEKLTGWSPNELPACNIFNWLHRLTSQWIQFLWESLQTAQTSLAGVISNLSTHIGLNGTAVHGLGTASTHDAADFGTSTAVSVLQEQNVKEVLLTGTIADTGTISYPTGFTYANCIPIGVGLHIASETFFKVSMYTNLNEVGYTVSFDASGIKFLSGGMSGNNITYRILLRRFV